MADTRHDIGGNGAVRLGFATLVLAFGGLGGWAAVAPLNAAAIAHGEVVVDSHSKSVQHREGGTVKAILVQDGQRVAAGQPLVILDDTAARAKWQQLLVQYWDGLASQARLLAERDGRSAIDFSATMSPGTDPRIAQMMRAQTNLFQARLRMVDGQVAVLKKRILQYQREAEALNVERRSTDRQLELMEEEASTARMLVRKGLGVRPRLLALERDAEKLRGERDDFAARIAQVNQGIASTELDITNLTYKHLEDAASELRKVEAETRALREELVAARDMVLRSVVRSPLDGVVMDLRVHAPGAVVEPGKDIVDVVPLHDRLVVDAHVAPEDIDRVMVGRPAQVRFLTFLPGLTPPARGQVTRVSADLLHDERTGQGYYLSRVELDPDSVAKLPGKPLPGMQTDVLITTGERTALQYLMDPLARAMSLGLREK
jgi:HlyD family type I secretion membrane fusion protein